jgi:hypothetical protein
MRHRALARVIAVGVSVVLLLAQTVPAMASPLGTGPVCDHESPYQICFSANGVSGNYVYGKTFSTDHEENTTVAAANVCNGTDVVDGGGTTCPFAQGGDRLNNKYSGDLIVQMYNSDENNMYYLGNANKTSTVQGPQGTGYLWVLAPISPGSTTYYLINVAVSSSITPGPSPFFACSHGADLVLFIDNAFQGDGACEWSFPG